MAISPENRKRFEQAGLEMMRADYVGGGHRIILPKNRQEAKEWIEEQEAEISRRESRRYHLMLILTGLAAFGALIAAMPVVTSWISN